jgi:GNAT superfamily N-acetyltransferase
VKPPPDPNFAPLDVKPATAERWHDVETLFGPRGAYSGCWCMYFRQTSRQFDANSGEGNRQAFQALVCSGNPPGLLAYSEGRAVGWCAVSPREELGRVLRSPTVRPLDDVGPAWTVSCFYIARDSRGRGISRVLLDAAVRHAALHGARAVEGFPVDTGGHIAPEAAYTGTLSMFSSAGFRIVEPRRSQRRPLVRLLLGSS